MYLNTNRPVDLHWKRGAPHNRALSRHKLYVEWRGQREWFVVGLEAVAIETAEDSWSVVLTLTPDDDGLDRAMFLCKATLTNSLEIEETITLSVQGRRDY